jgi:HTH-type transcriptional regulator, sugar sensing transcriptional regulator
MRLLHFILLHSPVINTGTFINKVGLSNSLNGDKMIVKKDTLKKLRSTFELNDYEVKIWISILSKGVATAGELSDLSDVPRSRAYDVLESLEKKGFIVMKLGRPIKYLAVAPEEIIKRVKKGIKERADEDVESLEKIKGTDAFDELSLLFNQGIDHVDPANISGSFKGRNNIHNHFNTMVSNAQSEISIATTSTGLVRKAALIGSLGKKLKQNQVKVKIIAPLNTESAIEAAASIKEIATVKDADLNSRFLLVDGKEIMFMLNEDSKVTKDTDMGVWVNTPFFAGSLKSLFDVVWSKK